MSVKVERGNTVLDINPENTDYYLSMGFSVVDDDGNILQKAIPTTIEELRKAYHEHTEQIKKLEAEIKKLKKSKSK